jgi:LPS sulfotransferase NodH
VAFGHSIAVNGMSSQQPYRGYVICSEHRSGSTLLCEYLRSTGSLGNPDEFFRFTEDSIRLERDPDLLAQIVKTASTPNGIYGLKVFSQQFDSTMKARWVERLPELRFIHLEREDLLGQAISLVKARQTQQFTADELAVRQPAYDKKALDRALHRISEGQMRWRRYFARNGIEPLRLTYEDLIAAPVQAVAGVVKLLGLPSDICISPKDPGLRVQRDSSSDLWRQAYLNEARDLTYLDHPLGKKRIWLRRFARDVAQAAGSLKGGRHSRP